MVDAQPTEAPANAHKFILNWSNAHHFIHSSLLIGLLIDVIN